MTLKESSLQRSCSAVLTTGKTQRNSCVDNVASLSQRSASTANKNNLHEEPSLSAVSRNKLAHKEKVSANLNSSCHCSDCTTEKDVPRRYIEELEGQLQSLTRELHEEKNNSQLLRRHVLVAKRVLEKEVGDQCRDFDSLMKKAAGESWKGRQEIILDLKRKMRELNEIVERTEGDSTVSRRKGRQKKDSSPEIIPEERKIFWCLELERQEVLRNALRHKEKMVKNRDSMKERLQQLLIRNEEFTKEISNLRINLSELPVNLDEEMMDRVHSIESKVKVTLEEKVESRRKLEDMEQQNCRNSRAILELKEKINAERKNVKNQQATLDSLRIDEDNLRLMFEDLNKEKCKQAVAMKKHLDDVDKDYSKIVIRLDKTLTSITDSKKLLEKLKTFREANKLKISSDSSKSCLFSEREEESGTTNSYPIGGNSSVVIVEMPTDGIVNMYKNELFEYQAALDFLEHRNTEKLKKLCNLSKKMREDVMSFLKKRYVLEKLRLDTKVLKNRLKKFRKVVAHPSQQKLVKKKNSSQQLAETLDEGRMQLNILKMETKFLKILIKKIFSSKEDDFELLDMFLEGNRVLTLKRLMLSNIEDG